MKLTRRGKRKGRGCSFEGGGNIEWSYYFMEEAASVRGLC